MSPNFPEVTASKKPGAVHASRPDTGKKVRNHIRQLEALGFAVTLTQAA